MKFTSESL